MPSDMMFFGGQMYEPGLDQPGYPDNECEMAGLNVDPADWYAVRQYAEGLGDVYTKSLTSGGGLSTYGSSPEVLCAPGYRPGGAEQCPSGYTMNPLPQTGWDCVSPAGIHVSPMPSCVPAAGTLTI